MHFHFSKNKQIHMYTILRITIIAFCIPTIAMILILFSYTVQQNIKKSDQNIKNTEKIIQLSLRAQMKSVKEISDTMSHKMDFLIFSNTSDKKRLYLHGATISDELRKDLQNNGIVAGFFLYSKKADYLYPSYVNLTDTSLSSCSVIRDKISKVKENTGTWSSQYVNDRLYLFYQISSRYGIYTIALAPSLNTEYRSVAAMEKNGSWSFTDKETIIPSKNKIIYSSIGSYPLKVLYEYPDSYLLQYIDRFQIIMIFLIIFLFCLVTVPWYWIRKTILVPVARMEELSREIQQGNPDKRLAIESNIWELQLFSNVLNQLLDNTQLLNQKIYEQKLDVTRARLQFLQLQIRPHFYLNCLKNMYALLHLQKYHEIEETILALSDYFAHSFRDVKNFVTLQDELTTCQSYITLQHIMTRDVSLVFDLDSQCMDAQILPMTILTFLENAVKYSDNQIPVTINISAELLQKDTISNPILLLELRNTGAFSSDVLELLNNADPSEMVYKHENIGISNVRYRLWLIYQEKAQVTFSNQIDQAVVTIELPFEQTAHT